MKIKITHLQAEHTKGNKKQLTSAIHSRKTFPFYHSAKAVVQVLTAIERFKWHLSAYTYSMIRPYGCKSSPTCFGQTWIPRKHVLVEYILFPLPNSPLKKNNPFVEQIREFNTNSLNGSSLFTTTKNPSLRVIKTHFERLDRNVMLTLLYQFGLTTMKPNHRPNGVNNLPSRPAIKTINSYKANRLHNILVFCLFV